MPLAIAVFLFERRKERANEEGAVYQLLSDNCQDFLRAVLEHPDLKLFAPSVPDLSEDPQERRLVIFGMLISPFERAYLLLFEPPLSPSQARRWGSWEVSTRSASPTGTTRRSESASCACPTGASGARPCP
ncbi:MAG: hypothetical protein WEF50_03485 [Myxococcota bacterium]